MKGIFYGVLNCTHCNFSLNRQNYKFLKKEINFSLREKETPTQLRIGVSTVLKMG